MLNALVNTNPAHYSDQEFSLLAKGVGALDGTTVTMDVLHNQLEPMFERFKENERFYIISKHSKKQLE
jgi:hypothetical protein